MEFIKINFAKHINNKLPQQRAQSFFIFLCLKVLFLLINWIIRSSGAPAKQCSEFQLIDSDLSWFQQTLTCISSLSLSDKVEFLWLFQLFVSPEILREGLRKMTKVGLLLSLLWILFIELGPGTLSFAEFLEDTLVSLLLVEVRILVDFLVLIHETRINLLESLRVA